MFNIGDIVLVPFPFTDLQSIKTRPALVVYVNHKFGDLVLLAITSVSCACDEIMIKNVDLDEGALPVDSYVRYMKFATVNEKLIRQKVAALGDLSLKKVLSKIRGKFEV
jgi:mRNA interferase MazF